MHQWEIGMCLMASVKWRGNIKAKFRSFRAQTHWSPFRSFMTWKFPFKILSVMRNAFFGAEQKKSLCILKSVDSDIGPNIGMQSIIVTEKCDLVSWNHWKMISIRSEDKKVDCFAITSLMMTKKIESKKGEKKTEMIQESNKHLKKAEWQRGVGRGAASEPFHSDWGSIFFSMRSQLGTISRKNESKGIKWWKICDYRAVFYTQCALLLVLLGVYSSSGITNTQLKYQSERE